LDDLRDSDLRPRLQAIQRAIGILKSHDIDVHVNGDFITALTRRIEGPVSNANDVTIRSHELAQGMTRDCLDPWTYFELNTNGDIQPCCAHSRVGNLNEEKLTHALNGPAIRRLRENLLQGTPDPECANCRLRAPARPETLREKVRAVLEDPPETVGMFFADKVGILMKTAVDNLEAGRQDRTWSFITRALAIDPGIERPDDYTKFTLRECLPRVLKEARYPLTLSWLAAVFRYIKDDHSAILLMKRYLEVAPAAPDRDRVSYLIREAESKTGKPASVVQTAGAKIGAWLDRCWLWLRLKVRLRTRLRLTRSGASVRRDG
jgi:radical SAM protein with 4Fe4S-binding SPASM domain